MCAMSQLWQPRPCATCRWPHRSCVPLATSSCARAQVVALLLKKLGPTFMSKLKGRFAFAVYDAHSGRVLAVRDCAGTHPLWQAHLAADHSLVIACGAAPPAAPAVAGEWTEVKAGEYKFGWRSAPLAYMASSDAVASRQEEARSAAMEALLVRTHAHPAEPVATRCAAPACLETGWCVQSASVPVASPPGQARHSVSLARPRPAPPRLGRASISDAYTMRRSFQADGPLMRAAASDAGAMRPPPSAPRTYGRASSTIERPPGSWRAPEAAALSRQSSYVPPHRRHSMSGQPGPPPPPPPPQPDARRSMSSSWRRDSALDAPQAAALSPPPSAALAINPPRAANTAHVAASSAFYRPATTAAAPPSDGACDTPAGTTPSTSSNAPSSRGPSRSQPIPIATPRTSRDSRTSASWRRPAIVPDAQALGRFTGIAEGSAEPASDVLMEAPLNDGGGRGGEGGVGTSEESVIGTGESSSEQSTLSGVGVSAADVAKKMSSMLFEWSGALLGELCAAHFEICALSGVCFRLHRYAGGKSPAPRVQMRGPCSRAPSPTARRTRRPLGAQR